MSYFTPSFEEIRSQMLRDVCNLDSGAHTTLDSDHYIRASATASVVEGLYDHQNWIIRQLVPDTADSEFLEIHARLRGLVRKSAVRATGHIIVSGLSGSIIPLGTHIQDASGIVYTTTKEVTLGHSEKNGQVQVMEIVPCQADKPGFLEHCQDALAMFVAPPLGVDTKVLLTISGGSNAETDNALLKRLLDYMRNPPGPGTALDYKRWAMAVPGVSKAYVYPLRQGMGTVDIVIAGEQSVLPTEVVAATQEYIDSVRPVTVRSVHVLAAVPKNIDVSLALNLSHTETLQTILPSIREALQTVFVQYEPGNSVVVSRLLAAVTSVPNVFDAAIVVPEENVSMKVVEVPTLGHVTLRSL